MKYLIFIALQFFVIRECLSDDRLIGSWKSSLELTKKYNDKNSRMTASQKEFLEQIIGDLKVTYGNEKVVTEATNKKVTIAGKPYDWSGGREESSYKVIASDKSKIVIRQYIGEDREGIVTIHFDEPDIYWVYLGEYVNVNGREYFVKVK